MVNESTKYLNEFKISIYLRNEKYSPFYSAYMGGGGGGGKWLIHNPTTARTTNPKPKPKTPPQNPFWEYKHGTGEFHSYECNPVFILKESPMAETSLGCV